MAGAANCALYRWGKFLRRGVGEGEVDSGMLVSVVPAVLPGRKGKFLGCRILNLKGDCVGLAVVWVRRVGCIVVCEFNAPFDASGLEP
jgi:hypothetical protein